MCYHMCRYGRLLMERDVEAQLLAWKDRPGRKPLVLMGARQVGKTWLMRQFARKNFAHVHEFNFDDTPVLATFFRDSKDPRDILPKLSVYGGRKIDPARDAVIFDGIQDCSDALNSLKYFREKCPELAILSAGSLLGVKLRQRRRSAEDRLVPEMPKSYPVGQVELVDVEPLSFSEFLRARKKMLWEYYGTIKGQDPIPEALHRQLWDEYLLYLTIGGMPEVVASYLDEGDPARVRKLQRDLVALYEDDIVKYNNAIDAAKILVVLRSVVPQLSKENSKFIYGALREGARGRGYEEAIEWLVSARMVRRVNNLSEIRYPLSSHSIRNAFKLYLNDIGMLKEMAAVTNESLVLDRDFAFKGRFVENYVLQQLAHRCEGPVHYWAERAEREIDFVLQQGGEAIPVEVKAGGDRKCASFKSFVNANSPKYAIRFSERNLKQDGKFVNIPLYLAERYQACL